MLYYPSHLISLGAASVQQSTWFFTAAIVLLVVFSYSGCNVDTIEETASGPDANAVLSILRPSR